MAQSQKFFRSFAYLPCLLWLHGNLAFAGQGCCSTHGGVAGCSGTKLQCNDGTLSSTCSCQGGSTTLQPMPRTQDSLALLETTPQEAKPYVTPVIGPVSGASVDIVPSVQGIGLTSHQQYNLRPRPREMLSLLKSPLSCIPQKEDPQRIMWANISLHQKVVFLVFRMPHRQNRRRRMVLGSYERDGKPQTVKFWSGIINMAKLKNMTSVVDTKGSSTLTPGEPIPGKGPEPSRKVEP